MSEPGAETATDVMFRQEADHLREKLFNARGESLKRKYKKFVEARQEYQEQLHEIFPLGAFVRWMHTSRSEQEGVVLLHGNYGRLYVRNSKTKVQTWIEAYQIIQAVGRPR